ncbi:C40 family peptidase [Amycolatopsis minnesotensis]|uniref:NlpC/P60 domain-containing protein n=1 Tax=Amycolatopsis minnesotensis TaxID=337894 RepID=A0ABN2QZ80_9PSEU
MPTSAKRRLASAGIACAAGAGALFAAAPDAAAIVKTQQTLDAAPTPVPTGTQVTFTGALTRLGDRPVAEQKVDLEWRGGADQPWSVSNSGTTDAAGKAAIPATVTVSAEWRISYHGDRVNDPAVSPVVGVRSQQPVGQRVVDSAAAQAGKPYSYGAAGPDRFDCSGLTQFVHKQVGIDLPRTSRDQRAALADVSKSDLKPGDLLFFADGGSVYHTGIFAGDGKMWAAPESGDVVRLQNIWTDAYTVGRAW